MMWKWNGKDILNPNYVTRRERKKGKMYLNDLMPCNDHCTAKKIVLEDYMIFCES